jgi:hypothetical protein
VTNLREIRNNPYNNKRFDSLKSLGIEGKSQYKLENESAARLRHQDKDLICSLKKLHINEETGETEV